ncbi:MAG: ABC transporter substrate-binding protein [Nitrospinae bacterium]|nr:ABC transporter substrate-binding protein [Nitrospinota bacterium]
MALGKIARGAVAAFAVCLAFSSPAFSAEPAKKEGAPPLAELLKKAGAAEQEKNRAKELAAYREMIENYPNDEKTALAYFRLAQNYLDAKQYGNAQSYFSVVANSFPSSPYRYEALVGLGASLSGLRQYTEAESAWQTALPAAQDDAERAGILCDIGDARYRSGQNVKSVEALVECWSLPSNLHTKAEERVKEIVQGISSTAELSAIEEKYGNGFPAQYALLELAKIHKKNNDQLNLERTRERVEKGFPGLEVPKDAFVTNASPRGYLTIGCILPLTGDQAEAGNQAAKGIQVALAAKSQFVDKAHIRPLIMDSEGNPETARAAMKTLSDDKSVIAVVGMFSPETLAAVLNDSRTSGVPIITPSLTAAVDTMQENKRFLYQIGITRAGQVRALVDVAANRLNLRTFAVMHPNDDYGRAFAQMFVDAIEKSGGTIVAKASYDPAQTDFREQMNALGGMDDQSLRQVIYDYAQEHTGKTVEEINGGLRRIYGGGGSYPRIKKVKSMPITKNNFSFELHMNFEALFVPASSVRQAVILPTLAFYNIKGVQVMGTDRFLSPELLTFGEKDAEEVLFTGEFYPELDKPDVKSFTENFQNASGESPDATAAQFYDAMLMALTLMEGGADTRWELSSGMDTLKYYKGVTGGVYWGPEGILEKMPGVYSVVNGKIVEYLAPAPPEKEQ